MSNTPGAMMNSPVLISSLTVCLAMSCPRGPRRLGGCGIWQRHAEISFNDVTNVLVAGAHAEHLQRFHVQQGRRRAVGVVFLQPVIDHHVGDRANLRLDVLDLEFGSAQAAVGRRAEQGMPLLMAQSRDFAVKPAGVHQKDDRIVARACRNGFAIEFAQQRMIHPARRDASERQVAVFGNRRHDVAPARAAPMKVAVNVPVADHGIELGRRAALRRENPAQRRAGAAEDGITDVVGHDRDAARFQGIESLAGVRRDVEKSQRFLAKKRAARRSWVPDNQATLKVPAETFAAGEGAIASSGFCFVSMPSTATTKVATARNATISAITPPMPYAPKIATTMYGVTIVIMRPMVLQKPAPRILTSVGNNSGT